MKINDNNFMNCKKSAVLSTRVINQVTIIPSYETNDCMARYSWNGEVLEFGDDDYEKYVELANQLCEILTFHANLTYSNYPEKMGDKIAELNRKTNGSGFMLVRDYVYINPSCCKESNHSIEEMLYGVICYGGNTIGDWLENPLNYKHENDKRHNIIGALMIPELNAITKHFNTNTITQEVWENSKNARSHWKTMEECKEFFDNSKFNCMQGSTWRDAAYGKCSEWVVGSGANYEPVSNEKVKGTPDYTFTSVEDFDKWITTEWETIVRKKFMQAMGEIMDKPEMKSYNRYLKKGAKLPKNFSKSILISWNKTCTTLRDEFGYSTKEEVIENLCRSESEYDGIRYEYNLALYLPLIRVEIEEGTFEVRMPNPYNITERTCFMYYADAELPVTGYDLAQSIVRANTRDYHTTKTKNLTSAIENKIITMLCEMDEVKELFTLHEKYKVEGYEKELLASSLCYNIKEALRKMSN